MPFWFSLLLTLLGWLIDWLLKRQQSGESLSDKEIKRLNGMLWQFGTISFTAVDLGCKPGGEPE